MLSIPVLVLATLYVGSVFARGGWSYYKFRIRQHSWSGQAWQADPTLGYAHVPGFRGRQSLRPEVTQAIRIDAQGFRVPEGGRPPGRSGPTILSLGGSYTFGFGVEAEETYTDLVASHFGGRGYNAGVNGYGLSQMILQSRQLMETVQPDIVIASYGYWLPQRAGTRYSSTRFAAVPVPFVAGDGAPVDIAPPAFRAKIFDLRMADHLTRPPGPVGALVYLRRVAFPLYFHDDFQRLRVRVGERIGSEPRPLRDRAAVARAGYTEILENATAAGARLYVLDIMSYTPPSVAEIEALESIPGLRFVPTRDILWSHVEGETHDDYFRVFAHWVDGVRVDKHPNAFGHQILAEEIWKAIEADQADPEASPAP
ncbi:MAG: hypothetical protein JRG83_00020 [Deltaproteobacteria bacterium]|nr:hypothetical protein [Deltaproteobacteria bacterium]